MAGEGVGDVYTSKFGSLAAKVRNIDGKVTGADGKPLLPKSILKNDKVGMVPPVGLEKNSGKENIGLKENVVAPSDVPVVGKPIGKSYSSVFQSSTIQKKALFCAMESNSPPGSDCDVHIPISSVVEVSKRLMNTLHGYFLGKRIAFPVVENYVKNAWGKLGLEKVTMHKGFMFFKFSTEAGVESVLENGPWLIRGSPLILNVWTPSVSLTKEDMSKVPVWVKLHDIPLVAFTAESLSLIGSQIGTPMRLDTFTNAMCLESWGRSSYARAMIEVDAGTDLKDSVLIAVPKLEGDGYSKEKIRIEYEWKPPRCPTCKVFGHGVDLCPKTVKITTPKEVEDNKDGFTEVKKGRVQVKKPKFVYRPKQNELASSSKPAVAIKNSFDVLNVVNDGDTAALDNANDIQNGLGHGDEVQIDKDKGKEHGKANIDEDTVVITPNETVFFMASSSSTIADDVTVTLSEELTGASTPADSVPDV